MSALQLEYTNSVGSLVRAVAKWPVTLLVSVYVLSCLAVAYKLNTPIENWRPADMASIALNYYRNGLRFLFPQILWGGSGPGYVETEFPIVPYATALMYKLFGVHEWLCLVIPWLSGLGIVVTVYFFGKLLFDKAVGVLAGIYLACSPTFIDLSTGFWPDPPMVFAGTLGLFFLVRWSVNGGWRDYLLGGSLVSLAILLKITALYIGIPLVYLCWSRYGIGFLRNAKVWLLALITLLPSIMWYTHAHALFVEYHNTFGILSSGYLKFATMQVLTDIWFYRAAAHQFVIYQLTPFVCLMFLVGLSTALNKEFPRLLLVWMITLAIYVLVAAKGVRAGHHQYLMPLLPPAVIVAGLGTVLGLKKLSSWNWFITSRSLHLAIAPLLIILLVGSSALGRHLYKSKDIYDYPVAEKRKQTGLAVGRFAEPGSLIIVTDNQMDDVTPETSMTPPEVFYFSDRHGWYLSMAWLTPELIERLHSEGARYFVVTSHSVEKFANDHSDIMQYFAGRYRITMQNADGIIYDMRQ